MASEIRSIVAEEKVNDFSVINFPEVKTGSMSIHFLINDFDEVKTDLTRNFSMDDEDAKAVENISKAEAVALNGVMMKPNECCIRYQNLPAGQKVKCILSSSTSLQKVKVKIHGDDVAIKHVIKCQNLNEKNSSFTRVTSSRIFSLNGVRQVVNFTPSSVREKYRYLSFSDVYKNHEVVNDVVDEKCMMCHGTNDSIEDDSSDRQNTGSSDRPCHCNRGTYL